MKACVCTSIKLLLVMMCFETSVDSQDACKTPDNQSGLCLPYHQCEKYLEYLNSTLGFEEFKSFLILSRCNSDRNIHICCGEISTQQTNIAQRALSGLNQRGLDVLNSVKLCGKYISKRISFGEVARIREFPWMALLEYDIEPPNQYQCGGSLITDRYVLTAAHCFKELYPIVAVILGEHNLNTDPDCQKIGLFDVCSPPRVRYLVEKLILHPEYRKHRMGFDIALIKLDRSVEFKKHIKPICLPITPTSMKIPSRFIIAGWGTTENGSTSHVLKKALIEFKNHSVCESIYNTYQQRFTSHHLCAGGGGPVGTCKADSGGPLFMPVNYIELSQRAVQYGVISFGPSGCAALEKFPDLFTNVIEFLPWITNNII